MPRYTQRLLVFLVAVAGLLLLFACLYWLGMSHLEKQPRSFLACFSWAVETVTTTGYGRDAAWRHPAMVALVTFAQFSGVLMIFLVFPLFLIPFLETRFEARISRVIPDAKDAVVVYGYDPAVAPLVDELHRRNVPMIFLEEVETQARRLLERGYRVALVLLEEDEPDLAKLATARALVLNGEDHNNAVMALAAREHGLTGPIIALIDDPLRRGPMRLVGATAAFTPPHILAASVAARASSRISPRVAGAQPLGRLIEVAELRIHAQSILVGKSLAESGIQQSGATIIGQWEEGDLHPPPAANTPLPAGVILVAVGTPASLEQLSSIARPITETGPLLVAGYGTVGSKVVDLLRAVDETVRVISDTPADGVDFVGDVLDRKLLERAGVATARAVILALEKDSTALFAATVIRDLAPDAPIIAAVNQARNVSCIRRAGADLAQSVGQVAGRLLVHHVLGEDALVLQPRLKLVKTSAGALVGKSPIEAHVRERTGCSVVAVERGDQAIVDFRGVALQADDTVYICGTNEAIDRFALTFSR